MNEIEGLTFVVIPFQLKSLSSQVFGSELSQVISKKSGLLCFVNVCVGLNFFVKVAISILSRPLHQERQPGLLHQGLAFEDA